MIFFGTGNTNDSSGLFGSIFGGGSTSSSGSKEQKPLFGSGGTYDDQKKPAGSQYIVYGKPKDSEQEVRDAINTSSCWGSLGGRCKFCKSYFSDAASLLDHESKCIYRK